MFELCMSGQALRILRRSSFAQTMKAFIGRLICGLPSGSRRLWRIIFAPYILAENKEKQIILLDKFEM